MSKRKENLTDIFNKEFFKFVNKLRAEGAIDDEIVANTLYALISMIGNNCPDSFSDLIKYCFTRLKVQELDAYKALEKNMGEFSFTPSENAPKEAHMN